MKTSQLSVIWANKPGCRLAAAEFWLGGEQLWFTIFFDEDDRELKMELLPPLDNPAAQLVDLSEAERLIATAKRELLAMSAVPKADRTSTPIGIT